MGGSRPRLLDLFCGAGGAARGYQEAGFHVTGVDIKPQPRYIGDRFIRADVMALLHHRSWLRQFDAIHASPPCQGYSRTRKIMEGKGWGNPKASNLVDAVRDGLSGFLYVIENVPGAPLLDPITLCGTMFGLRVYRHRRFESSIRLHTRPHPVHDGSTGSHRGYSAGRPYVTVGGHNYRASEGKAAMGIGWMTRDELNEAIPPAYTQFIGAQLLAEISRSDPLTATTPAIMLPS